MSGNAVHLVDPAFNRSIVSVSTLQELAHAHALDTRALRALNTHSLGDGTGALLACGANDPRGEEVSAAQGNESARQEGNVRVDPVFLSSVEHRNVPPTAETRT